MALQSAMVSAQFILCCQRSIQSHKLKMRQGSEVENLRRKSIVTFESRKLEKQLVWWAVLRAHLKLNHELNMNLFCRVMWFFSSCVQLSGYLMTESRCLIFSSFVKQAWWGKSGRIGVRGGGKWLIESLYYLVTKWYGI